MVAEGLAPRNYPLFSAWDYVVFAIMLCISAGIGIFYAFKGGGQKSTKEFLLADRSMSVPPVAMSLLASFMSAITVLGTPAEVYTYGTMFWMFWITYMIMVMVSAHFYLPVFFDLGVTSAYEYLERRFSPGIRRLGSFTFICQMVCVMLAGFLAVIIQGSINEGGFSEIWRIAERGQRVEFFNFDPDPRVRHSTWSVLFGGLFTWVAIFGVNQSQVQRYLSVEKKSRAQIALYLNGFGLVVIVTLAAMCGLVMYARYENCDPITAGFIQTSDQMMPFTVMEILSYLPGIPGLFVSSVFAGALSTMSSGLNSLSAVTLEDFVKPYKKNLTEAQYTVITKILVAIFGGLMMLMAWVSSYLGSVLQAALSIFGMIGGPLLGLFTLGMFFPWANTIGAYSGMLVGFVMTFWVGIGAQVWKPIVPKPPVSIAGCERLNVTNVTTSAVSMATELFTGTTEAVSDVAERPALAELYNISYLYYSLIAVLSVLIVGLIVSFLTGAQDPAKLDPRLISPFFDIVCCCCPGGCLRKLHCGVQHDDKDAWDQRDREKAAEAERDDKDRLELAEQQQNGGIENGGIENGGMKLQNEVKVSYSVNDDDALTVL
ncbi:PREDICTED: sodium-coupled monocarboxylate transporter 1-like [Branchiostoma belcheri]|uniref:Sodium-coupled monocarboxylate transporter 1-like n=1 Tax=Branchiostoma belcheri TaxID=7741 RepID=A0A6P4ZVS9_BRABE|nr:PREDICTED: sodium-coupled monocarboxylate transporter 1-like [Branchiostoma belcheri]